MSPESYATYRKIINVEPSGSKKEYATIRRRREETRLQDFSSARQ